MCNRHGAVRMIHCSSLILMSLTGNSCLHESSLITASTRKRNTDRRSWNIVAEIFPSPHGLCCVFVWWTQICGWWMWQRMNGSPVHTVNKYKIDQRKTLKSTGLWTEIEKIIDCIVAPLTQKWKKLHQLTHLAEVWATMWKIKTEFVFIQMTKQHKALCYSKAA